MLPWPSPGPQREWEARLSPQQLWGQVQPEGRAFCRWAAPTHTLCRGERARGAWTPTDEQEQSSWHLLGLCHRRPSGSSDSYHPKASLPTQWQGTLVRSSRSCIYPAAARTQASPCQRKLGGSLSSVQFSHSVVSDSLQPHEPQHARPPCPLPTPRVYSDSCPSSQWCHPTISSSVVLPSIFPSIRGEAYLAVRRLWYTFPSRAVILSLAKTEGFNKSRVS